MITVLMFLMLAGIVFLVVLLSLERSKNYDIYNKLAQSQVEVEVLKSGSWQQQEKVNQLMEINSVLGTKLNAEIGRNKSVEVRTGLMVEKMAPFLDIFKYDPNDAHFIGQPIDFIVFSPDEIVFLEVKSGKSRATKKQNNIKELVEAGKVKFELIRLDYE